MSFGPEMLTTAESCVESFGALDRADISPFDRSNGCEPAAARHQKSKFRPRVSGLVVAAEATPVRK